MDTEEEFTGAVAALQRRTLRINASRSAINCIVIGPSHCDLHPTRKSSQGSAFSARGRAKPRAGRRGGRRLSGAGTSVRDSQPD